jgi:anti-sigma B factor antagonist
MRFDYKIRQEFGVTIIEMSGDLVDRSQAADLVKEFDALIQNKQLKYIFDLAELKYMNSTGLNVLINLFTRTRREGGEVIISNVNKKINELLLITKLTSLFMITDNIEKAVAKLK